MMPKPAIKSLRDVGNKSLRSLRTGITVLVATLGLLLWFIVDLTVRRAEEEGFYQQRFYAEQAAAAITRELLETIESEATRSIDQYSFVTVETSDLPNQTQSALLRSPLSQLEPQPAPPGLVGYFQIDSDGLISSPLLPSLDEGSQLTSLSDLPQRQSTFKRLTGILNRLPLAPTNSLQRLPVQESLLQPQSQEPNTEINAQLYDQRQLRQLQGSIKESPIDLMKSYSTWSSNKGKSLKQSGTRREVSKVALNISQALVNTQLSAPQSQPEVTSFEAEVDPFQALSLEGQFVVLYRKAWRNRSRLIQGLIVESRTFFERSIVHELMGSALAPGTTVLITRAQQPIFGMILPSIEERAPFSAADSNATQSSARWQSTNAIPQGQSLLFSASLPPPLNSHSIYFSLQRIPRPPGATLLIQVVALLALALLLGCIFLYQSARTQVLLAEKRSDFVSAISHELRSPLTSIRMYGEMLRDGWVKDESKRQQYYEYIFRESERLSRLIGNVLRLAGLERGTLDSERRSIPSEELLAIATSKVSQMVEAEGFQLTLQPIDSDLSGTRHVLLDEDAFAQIVVNLVDNALKFAKDAERKEIELGTRWDQGSATLAFFVRDFGPGIPASEQDKIFQLFYRSERELTRKTSGTGIGLALVLQLAQHMGAQVRYISRTPGAEFQILFPVQT